jgi:release factor glutamine methyltransferase
MRSDTRTRAMAKSELHSGDYLAWWLNDASARLDRAGIMTPRHDAERIAAHVMGLRWGEVVSMSRTKRIDPVLFESLDSLVARRAAGEPLAYIEGVRGFYGLDLACGPGVLVPRPETETVVDVALELIDGVRAPVVVDIGTGTGAIALAVATQRPDADVVATDVSEEALIYAHRNAKTLGLDVWLACGDLFGAVPAELMGRVDLVVSNPPYVRDGADLPADVRAEPGIALFGGPDGTDVLVRLAREAPRWLRPGGALVMEIGDADQASVLPQGRVRSDLTGRPRVVWARS